MCRSSTRSFRFTEPTTARKPIADCHMRTLWTYTIKLNRLLSAKLAWLSLRLRLGSAGIPGDLSIGRGVNFSVTDGGELYFNSGCSVDHNASLIVKTGKLSVGPNAHIGIGAIIVARDSIRIGSNALVAEYVTIRDQDHAFDGVAVTASNGFRTAPIFIGNNVWLGAKVTVTKGVTIGDNVIVGANSVVTRDIPSNCVAAGVPARVLHTLPAAIPVLDFV